MRKNFEYLFQLQTSRTAMGKKRKSSYHSSQTKLQNITLQEKENNFQFQASSPLTTSQQQQKFILRDKIPENKENTNILQNEICQMVKKREYPKVLNKIKFFLFKNEKDEFAKDRVQYYQILEMILLDNDEIKQCMDKTAYVLGVLSQIDFSDTDSCLRSLKANYKAFNVLKQHNLHYKKIHGKSMVNILNSLEKFNDCNISYLQLKKEKQKNEQKGNDQIVQIKKYFQTELEKKQKIIQSERKKIASLEVQLQKAKKKIEVIGAQVEENKSIEKKKALFRKKTSNILQKMNKDNFTWEKDYQNLKKDCQFLNERVFGQFFLFTDLFQKKIEEKLQKQVQSFKDIHEEIRKVFHLKNKSNSERFDQISKILHLSGKKKCSKLFDLENSLQVLMVTITSQTVQIEAFKKLRKDYEQSKKKLSQSGKEREKLNNEINNFKFQYQMSESTNSTPPGSRIKVRNIKQSELQTYQEQSLQTSKLQELEETIESKFFEIEKILKAESTKNAMIKNAAGLLKQLRNILFQVDSDPKIYQKKNMNASHVVEKKVFKQI